MASNVHVTAARRNAMIDNLTATLNSGFLDIYDSTGTGQPANADTAITTQVKLASLTFNATAFGAASSGSATANAITDDSAADATGTATWARWWQSNHTTPVLDCSVGSSGADINFNTVSIVINAAVSVTSLTVSIAA